MSEEDKNIIISEVTAVGDPTALSRVEAATSSLGYDLTTDEMNFIVQRIGVRSFAESLVVLKDALEYHKDDPNVDYDILMRWKKLCEGRKAWPELSDEEYEFEVQFETCIVADWSPYAEVRSATSMLDDPDEPCETLRMYVIAIIFSCLGCLVGTFFANRFPHIGIPFEALQLAMYPCGTFMHYILPNKTFKVFGLKIALNPGPWSYKEQVLATQMVSGVDFAPSSISTITQQRAKKMFNLPWASDYGYMILLTLSGQFLGYGFAGIFRGLLIYPVKCLWYQVLPLLTMNRALVKREPRENVHGWTLSRFKFFFLFFTISFCWYWFPNFVFQALSYFNWTTWISPNNVKLAAVTGVINGLGMNPINTFDWSNIRGGGMVNPFYTVYNSFVGKLLGFFVVIAIYFSRSFYTNFLPINASGVYDNTGAAYDVSQVLDTNGNFDNNLYQSYSPAFLSAGGLVNFGGLFALYIGSIVYTLLYYWDQLVVGFRSMCVSFKSEDKARSRYDDPFTRAMQVHPEVPSWWFVMTIIISIVLFIVMVEVYRETDTPVWTVFFAIVLNLVFIVPLGLLLSQTGMYLEVGFFTKILIGYLKPHNANALLITEYISNNFWSQAESYLSAQKQTHYARIPSRSLFRVQYIGTLLTAFSAIALMRWEFTGIKGYCELNQPQKFTCKGSYAGFASTILWGTIGPKAYFQRNGLYPALKYCFLIGALIPVPHFLLERFNKKQLRRWNSLVLLDGFADWAPDNFLYTLGNVYIGVLFNFYIRKRYLRWWQKYNYVLYSALNAGVAIAGFILFYATGYKHIASINWWGNTVSFAGADSMGIPLDLPPADKGYFGPDPGNFPNAL